MRRRAAPLFAALFAALVSALVVGCSGRPIDPLAQDRARLLALDDEPLPNDFAPEATLVVGGELLRQNLERALLDAASEAGALLEVPTPAGALGLTPSASVESLALSPGAACVACADVSLVVVGELEGRLGPLRERLPYRLETRVPLELVLVGDAHKDRVLARVATGGAPRAEVSFGDLPPILGERFSELLADRLRALLARGLVPDLVVAELPKDERVRVRGLRARPVALDGGKSALAVELAFVALERGRVEAVPDPGDGFLVAIPDETLLGVARAAALRAEPLEGFVVEPKAVSTEGERFTLELAVWRIAPEPVADRYRVEGALQLADGELKLVPERATLAGTPRFSLDPVDLLVRARVLEELKRALTAALPSSGEQEVALSRKVVVELVGVEGRDGVLLLRGRARFVAPGASPRRS